jgi:hypothetical protein
MLDEARTNLYQGMVLSFADVHNVKGKDEKKDTGN